MDTFLRKYKLIDSVSFTLNCDKATFIEKFKENVEPSNLSFSPFEAFSGGSKLYKGTIQISTFKIQRKQQLFSNKIQNPISNGKITEDTNTIKIDLEINGITSFMKIFFMIFMIFEIIAFLTILFFIVSETDFPIFSLPYILFHTGLFILIFYLLIKFSVKSFKQDIEREIHFWLR